MNVDFVPIIRGVRVLCKPRLIFSRINGPNIKIEDEVSKEFMEYRCVLKDKIIFNLAQCVL